MPFRSIRLRLTLWYVLLLAIALAAFGAAIYLTLRHSLYDGLNDSIQNRAALLEGVVRYEGGAPTLDGIVSPNDPNADDTFVRVFDASGLIQFDQTPGGRAVDGNGAAVDRALQGSSSGRDVKVGNESYRSFAVPLRQDGQISGALEVGESKSDVSDTLRTLLLILAVGYPATLAVASFGGVFLAGRALSPIDRLTQMARRISAEDLGKRLDLQLPDDEVGRLARTFDEMIARLDDAFSRQRQFTADASHELRTPLTAMKGQVEVALSKPRDAAAYRQVLDAVNEEVERMIRLVGSLLTLARTDAGQVQLIKESINLQNLIAGSVEQVRPLAEERGIALSNEAGPNASVRADENLLLQLFLNLLDNAIKFTPVGGTVTIASKNAGDYVELTVHDTGAGIADKDLPHLYDRFYRVDKARSRSEGGAGLGLAISRWIVEAHGGAISVESTPGQGTTFTVRLPRT